MVCDGQSKRLPLAIALAAVALLPSGILSCPLQAATLGADSDPASG